MIKTRQSLRELMAAKGLTAYALARLAGVDQALLSRLLHGTQHDIMVTTLDKLCKALGISRDEVDV